MHCRILGCTMKMSYRYDRLLICDINRATKIDGMGSFKKFKLSLLCAYGQCSREDYNLVPNSDTEIVCAHALLDYLSQVKCKTTIII